MKRDLKVQPVAFSLRCAMCGGEISKTLIEAEPLLLLQWRCSLCKSAYGPAWRPEPRESDLPTLPHHGESPVEPAEEFSVFTDTMRLLAQKGTRRGEITYLVVRALVSLFCAGLSIFLEMKGVHHL